MPTMRSGTPHVGPRASHLFLGFAQHHRTGDEAEQPERDVDPERPLPATTIDQPATERRTESARHTPRCGPVPHGHTAMGLGELARIRAALTGRINDAAIAITAQAPDDDRRFGGERGDHADHGEQPDAEQHRALAPDALENQNRAPSWGRRRC